MPRHRTNGVVGRDSNNMYPCGIALQRNRKRMPHHRINGVVGRDSNNMYPCGIALQRNRKRMPRHLTVDALPTVMK